MSPQLSSPAGERAPYFPVETLKSGDRPDGLETHQSPLKPTWVLYSSALVPLLQPLLYGWSTGQLNLSAFNNVDDCSAVPIAKGTCMMFPGHTKNQWTLAVCAWIVGGMLSCLVAGRLSDRYGRRSVMIANCLIIIISGSCIQASAPNIWSFMGGRMVSGIATGCATCVIPGYIGEISPPHLRSKLGVGFQIAVATGNFLVSTSFFLAESSTGWRFIAGFPMVFAGLFLLLSSFAVVESPVWLFSKNRTQEARFELVRLFGEEHCCAAEEWITSNHVDDDVEVGCADSHQASKDGPSISALFSPKMLLQLVTAIGVAGAQQLTGINAVFYYSSSLFKAAGISDDRIGIIAVSMVNMLPTLFSGMLAQRFGNYRLILCGMVGMFISAVGMTVALVTSTPVLAIVFTASYVAVFGSTLGALAWVVMAELFPNELRASGTSICVFCSWIFNLAVGVSYPYIAAAFGHFCFVPFIGSVAIFFSFIYTMVPDTSGKTCDEIQQEFRERRMKKIEQLAGYL